jgi:hypothetical protein
MFRRCSFLFFNCSVERFNNKGWFSILVRLMKKKIENRTKKRTMTERRNIYKEKIAKGCEKCGKAKYNFSAWKGVLCDECRERNNARRRKVRVCVMCKGKPTGFILIGKKKSAICTLCHINLLQQRIEIESVKKNQP